MSEIDKQKGATMDYGTIQKRYFKGEEQWISKIKKY